MIKLIRQGYYKEMPHGEPTDPSIHGFLYQEKNADQKEKICSYLNHGVVIIACYGLAEDVVEPERGNAGCPSMMTDGTFVWSGDLSYYVSKYSLKLQDDFISAMSHNNWTVPVNEDDLDFDNLEIEG